MATEHLKWCVGNWMCCKCKLHTGFQRLSTKKVISVPSTQFFCEPKAAIKYTTIFMGERVEGRGRLGVWDWHVWTAIFKIDN